LGGLYRAMARTFPFSDRAWEAVVWGEASIIAARHSDSRVSVRNMQSTFCSVVRSFTRKALLVIGLTFKSAIFNECGPLPQPRGHRPHLHQWNNSQIINVTTAFSDSLQSIRMVGDDSLYKLAGRQS
jgi:hypothetical protein